MERMHEFDFASVSEAMLPEWLLAKERRPNLLVECGPRAVNPVLHHVLRSSTGPHRWCKLPGTLELPIDKNGTLLLENVAALTPPQQHELHEWMSSGCTDMQVVSVTTVPLETSVKDGQFLEPLFYRLNVVRIEAPLPLAA